MNRSTNKLIKLKEKISGTYVLNNTRLRAVEEFDETIKVGDIVFCMMVLHYH